MQITPIKYIRTKDAAKLIGCKTSDVRVMLRSGELKGIQDDNMVWYVDHASVLKYIGKEPAAQVEQKEEIVELETNPEQDLAQQIIENTNDHLLLVGKAGSGKTTFLRRITKESKKILAVLAPSGIAAIEAGGVTIHSFFRFDTLPYVPGQAAYTKEIDSNKAEVIRRLQTIIIDEISMVRADLMDRIDVTLRAVRGNSNPFGGVQIVMIGDLRQLPPVVEDGEDAEIMEHNYDSPYFFDSKVWQSTQFRFIELKKVYRQKEGDFVELLNRVRENKATAKDINTINSKWRAQAWKFADSDSINLVTHNYMAWKTNSKKLRELPGKEFLFIASPDYWHADDPAPYKLYLKKGAHVMFVKNNPPEYSNGTLGIVTDIDDDYIEVRIKGSNKVIDVEPATWIDYDYKYNREKNNIEIISKGTYRQYPLRPAWAITVHKSQGQTFDKVLLDIGKCFAEGQAYVALSRCRSFDGITMVSKLRQNLIMTDSRIDKFLEQHESEKPKPVFVFTPAKPQRVAKPVKEKDYGLNKTTLASITAFKNGQSVEDIAAERNLVPGTIAGHITKGIEVGLIELSDVVDDKVSRDIINLYKSKDGEITRKEVFEAFNETVSYTDINYVFAYLKIKTI